ncbi:L-2-amino-thiazoline-4-carboxylic acid hydrolase [Methanobacterium alcaliphilum]|uniref:L-2-amino-thiazoline-4-carboxylic acid hydrolase n=1 Tax=Methanobacterium alcaliphilum TaxID=392018 RepID=UPI00200B4B1C|nr:L-2-amino-thiazoline-4-carboxylic acid hydrolase [Methanobacterium alcaliphilum]MCK9150415.1 L-2-amino-thiazoline-4-carboxylic acid hydrolase [Methanobacterium alcaliphilum]
MTGYSTEEKSKLSRRFQEDLKDIQKLMEKRFGGEFSSKALPEIEKEYKSLLEEIPYIGGEKNPLTITVTSTTPDLAIYLVLKRMGKYLQDIGELCYHRHWESFKKNRHEIMSMDDPRAIGFLKYLAAESEKREYPGNFVYEFVDGEGEDFDYGLDFKECAICKFFHSKGADEFVPYMCATDIAESEWGGLGLSRTTTLAEGNDKCDFRYKKGGKTNIDSNVINPGDFR